MIYQKGRVKYGTITIPYQIIKTGRIKTSEVIVDADSITVRTPYNKEKAEIQKLVIEKARWILRKQKEYRETVPQITRPSFKEDTSFPYLGKNYSMQIEREASKKPVWRWLMVIFWYKSNQQEFLEMFSKNFMKIG